MNDSKIKIRIPFLVLKTYSTQKINRQENEIGRKRNYHQITRFCKESKRPRKSEGATGADTPNQGGVCN